MAKKKLDKDMSNDISAGNGSATIFKTTVGNQSFFYLVYETPENNHNWPLFSEPFSSYEEAESLALQLGYKDIIFKEN